MRCKGCNKVLSKTELVAKDSSGNFEDMCNRCKRMSGIYTDLEAMSNDTEDYLGDYQVEYDYEGESDLMEELTGISRNYDILDDL